MEVHLFHLGTEVNVYWQSSKCICPQDCSGVLFRCVLRKLFYFARSSWLQYAQFDVYVEFLTYT